MDSDDPFADGRNMVWELSGFGADDELRACRTLTREQFLRVRHLFGAELGDDPWMMAGDYPVSPDAGRLLAGALGDVHCEDGVTYFLGGRQDLPGGGVWRPA